MATEVTLPALGESVSEGTISRWLKAVGDTVEADEPLLEVSTDKVDTEIPSPAAGTLLEIRFQEDDVAEVGAVLAIVGEASELHMTLAQDILAEKGANEIRPFDILARSFSSPEASRVFRELIDDGFVKPFASKCLLMSEQRASMVAAFLAGVSILRDVIGTPALQSGGNDRELMALVSQVVEFIMNEDKGCQTMTTAVPISREPQ